MKLNCILFRVLSMLGIGSSLACAQDVTAVNWGGNYVSTTQTFTDLTGFSTTSPIMDTGPSYSGTSATFYGGAHSPNTTYNYFTSPNDTGITDNGANDEITFSWPGSSTTSAFGEVLWQKANYLNGASTTAVVFDSASNIAVSLVGTPALTRFIVEDGSTYYISNLSFTTSTTLTDPDNATTWATYVPSAPISSLPFDAATATFSQHTFSDVEAIGYYFDSENNTSQTYDYGVSNFSSQVESVPEPTSIALLILSLFVLAGSQRVCRRRAQAS